MLIACWLYGLWIFVGLVYCVSFALWCLLSFGFAFVGLLVFGCGSWLTCFVCCLIGLVRLFDFDGVVFRLWAVRLFCFDCYWMLIYCLVLVVVFVWFVLFCVLFTLVAWLRCGWWLYDLLVWFGVCWLILAGWCVVLCFGVLWCGFVVMFRCCWFIVYEGLFISC